MQGSTANPSALLWLLLLGPSMAQAGNSMSIRSSGGRPSPGCGKAAPFALNTLTNRTVPSPSSSPSNSTGRPYSLWIPPSYDPTTPTPLIISLHGAGRTAGWQADLDRLADPRYGFNADHAVAYAQSTGATAADRYWEGYPGLLEGEGEGEVDDVAYVLSVADAVAADLCVDLARVYASGKSQGGGMAANVLACDARAAGRLAAFASVSGAYYVPPDVVAAASGDGACDPLTVPLSPCDPGRGRKVPVLAFHGGNDTTIAYGGGERRGFCLPAVTRWVEGWVERDGLAEEPVETRNLTRDATVFVYGGGDGEDDTGLVTFVYAGDRVGHDWPATFANTDNEEHGTGPASFNASSIIMEFFRNYTLSDAETSSPTSTPTPSPTSTSPTEIPTSAGSGRGGGMSTPPSMAGQLITIFIGLAWAFF